MKGVATNRMHMKNALCLLVVIPFHFFCYFATQRQHHHQRDQLCHQRVRRLRHLLHPGLHGTQPERARVGGGRPRPRPGLRGLPRSPHSAPHLPTVVAALLLHAHPSRSRDSGEVKEMENRMTRIHVRDCMRPQLVGIVEILVFLLQTEVSVVSHKWSRRLSRAKEFWNVYLELTIDK